MAAGLAIDIGYLRYQRRLLQMAADSAAIAGAANIIAGAANINCTGADCVSGEAGINSWYNGFNPTSQGTTVTISNPPADGAYAGTPNTANYVEAIITQKVPTFFMKILGPSFSSYSVSARAVAYPGPGPSCIYALQGGILFAGQATDLEATGCTVADGGSLCLPAPSYILDTMGAVYAASYSNCSTSLFVNPTPVPGAPAGNPLAYLSNNTPPTAAPGSPCSYTYCQGYYPSGIQIVGSSSVTFEPGPYNLGAPGLSISGTGTVKGTGVTFYITGNGGVTINNTPPTDYSGCGGATPNLGRLVQLSAPTDLTDPNAGILFVQTQSQADTITLNNGDGITQLGIPQSSCTIDQTPLETSSWLWGVLYFPSAPLTLIGTGQDSDNACSPIPRFTIAVAYELTLEGNINFGVSDCGPTTPYVFVPPLPNPIKDAVLVE